MKSVIISAVVTFVALVCIVWIGRGQDALIEPESEIPEPTLSGPQPKVVIDETSHDFGLMEVGQNGSHVFTIRNEGEGVLTLLARIEDTTCQCTFGELGDDGNAELQPGESTPVNVKWKIKSAKKIFMHAAIVRTNDPEYMDIRIEIIGEVGRRLVILPSLDWGLGIIRDSPVEKIGSLYSEIVDEFKVVKIESDSPYLTSKTTPLAEDELRELLADPAVEQTRESQAMSTGGGAIKPGEKESTLVVPKCGYRFQVMLSNEMPIGQFRGSLTIHIDESKDPYTIYVTGNRLGPIEVFATYKSQWYSKIMTLQMGDFLAKEGRTSKAILVLKNCKKEIEILDAKFDSNILDFRYEIDPETVGQETQRFQLTFEVPPGKLPMVRPIAKPVPIRLTTSHPSAQSFSIGVVFVSR